MGFKLGDFPESEKYYSEAISLPMYPNFSEEDQNKVVDILASIVTKK
jgi:dTDP-4-amino-4,6-dideoxygalactose transaminase